jgi:hypothetical protein
MLCGAQTPSDQPEGCSGGVLGILTPRPCSSCVGVRAAMPGGGYAFVGEIELLLQLDETKVEPEAKQRSANHTRLMRAVVPKHKTR